MDFEWEYLGIAAATVTWCLDFHSRRQVIKKDALEIRRLEAEDRKEAERLSWDRAMKKGRRVQGEREQLAGKEAGGSAKAPLRRKSAHSLRSTIFALAFISLLISHRANRLESDVARFIHTATHGARVVALDAMYSNESVGRVHPSLTWQSVVTEYTNDGVGGIERTVQSEVNQIVEAAFDRAVSQWRLAWKLGAGGDEMRRELSARAMLAIEAMKGSIDKRAWDARADDWALEDVTSELDRVLEEALERARERDEVGSEGG